LLFEGKVFGHTKVEKVFRSDFVTVPVDAPLSEIAGKLSNGTHTALILNENNQVVNTISQSDIISYLAQNGEKLLGDGMNMPLSQLFPADIFDRSVISMRPTSSVYSALEVIQKHRIHGIPVVDDGNKVVAAFSTTDLQPLTTDWNFRFLSLHVIDYLETCNLKKMPVTCEKTTSIRSILDTMVDKGVHRIFVVGKDNKLEGVITMTDFLKHLSSNTKPIS